MEYSSRKRCKKRLICDSDSSSESEESKHLKYRKVYQRVIPIRSRVENVKILKNVQTCPPSTAIALNESESNSDYEIFTPIKKHKKICNQINQEKENQLFASPSTGKQYRVLGSTKLRNPEVSCSPIVLTPTQKFRENNYNKSRASSPDSLNIFGEISRCSSLSNISFSNLLPVQLSEENIQELLKTTSLETKQQERRQESQQDKGQEKEQAKQLVEQLNKHQEQEEEYQEQEKEHQEQVKKHQEQEEEHQEQEKEHQEQEKEHQEQEKEHQEQEKEHQDQEEEHQKQEEEQVRQDYSEQQAENDINSENIIQASNNDDETDGDTDISIESSESSDIEVDEGEESENENELEEENQIAESECNDNEDGWIDISDDVRIDFDESTLNSAIIPLLHNKLPMEIYSLFLTEEIISKIVQDTNKYAEKYFEDHQDDIKAKSRLKAWKPTEDQEMRRFFGVILVMGLNKVPHINDYWSKKAIYRNEYICSIMSRDRFLIILTFWHFCDESINNTEDNRFNTQRDKLYKIHQIHDMLNTRFQQVLRPGKIVVIDESMIPWRGRLKFRQYIKNKSHKYGVKLYKLCTPEGYTYKTLIYTGKEGNNREQDHGKNTVLRLIRGLENEGRIVIADNFYSSVGLAEELLAKKTFYCGTLRSNRRGLSKNVISTKLKKGQSTGKMKPNGVKVIKWCDKRQVLMITTCKNHNAVLVNTGKKTRATNEDIQKPSCVILYNKNKKGIDYSDQMSSYYTTLKRGLKWYRKVMAEFLFGTALVNAWIIYNMSTTNNKMPKKDFTESIIEALTGRSISERAAGASSDMGSEHYCLRWNNHQSNLLGVFSQLLHDESLVDVTLACSEGASIRAHKVVLSACSSYFRSLFVDHPSRHPIVILKDVGLEELRTLVDFMYKGEVNVQYCQLPALLKTAESLQVKGLAEMTTLSAAGIDARNVSEPMEECQQQEARECTEPHERLNERDIRDKEERREVKDSRENRERDCKDTRESHREARETRELREHREWDRERERERDLLRETRDTRDPRDHRESRNHRDLREVKDSREPRDMRDPRDHRESKDPRDGPEASPPRISPLLTVRRFRPETSIETPTLTHPPIPKDEPPDEPMRPSSPEDDSVSIRSNGASESMGINMTINSHGVLGPRYSPVEQRLSVLNTLPHPGLPHPSHSSLSSPRNEPIAGPSGLPPVQQVPLSLKKEADWERSNDEKMGEPSTEYRLQHESEYEGSGRGRVEEAERAYPCIHCGATFPHQSKLTRHILTTHTLDTLKYRDALMGRPMGLPLIGQFSEPTYMSMPAEESPLDLDIGPVEPGNVVLCKFCGKSFPDVSSLIAHLPVHTGDRPFKCEFCGKAFKLRHHMKDHCRVHTGERPFRCVLCGKTFSRSTILKAHEKTHYPKYARKFLSPSPVDTEEESPHQ